MDKTAHAVRNYLSANQASKWQIERIKTALSATEISDCRVIDFISHNEIGVFYKCDAVYKEVVIFNLLQCF